MKGEGGAAAEEVFTKLLSPRREEGEGFLDECSQLPGRYELALRGREKKKY